ncbi:MAG: phosphatidylglycerol lysyltransferase domain-containing protein [Desulforhopalus sp.]|nr:phosphatidylglycerol lysyltransferase domain-containing protein [Desulforhopalus sp.]
MTMVPISFPETISATIPLYPDAAPVTLAMRPLLHPLFQALCEGISEFTFANIYLFREEHHYRLSRLADGTLIILGRDGDRRFFMAPFALPDRETLEMLLADNSRMKCVSTTQTPALLAMGLAVSPDRDNFDYLYSRQELAELTGRKFMKKRNLIKAFLSNHRYEGRPLLEEYLPDALGILEAWKDEHDSLGDYAAAREALERGEELQLCGGIYYVDDQPAAYTLGEELACGTSFVIHFEKALNRYKGLYQFVNQAFASIISDPYTTLNREQDLGQEGLRHAKLSYRPIGFVEKYTATLPVAAAAGTD